MPVAFCPKHTHRLDIVDRYRRFLSQDTRSGLGHLHLICPVDSQVFKIDGDSFLTMRRRYEASREADELKGATYRDLDNIYTPVLRVEPKPKDKDLSLQFEIDKTAEGKKIVIYAADKKDTSKKSHIFIDPQKESMTFDGKDLHPNSIFAKVEITYKSGKRTILEEKRE